MHEIHNRANWLPLITRLPTDNYNSICRFSVDCRTRSLSYLNVQKKKKEEPSIHNFIFVHFGWIRLKQALKRMIFSAPWTAPTIWDIKNKWGSRWPWWIYLSMSVLQHRLWEAAPTGWMPGARFTEFRRFSSEFSLRRHISFTMICYHFLSNTVTFSNSVKTSSIKACKWTS